MASVIDDPPISASPTVDSGMVRADLAGTFTDRQRREILAIRRGGNVQSAIVDNVRDAVRIIGAGDREGIAGWYVGVNPVDLACRPPMGARPNGGNVPTLTALFLDFDFAYPDEEPKRGTSGEELELTRRCRDRVYSQLVTMYGFPLEPLRCGISGNGSYLLWRLPDLANTPDHRDLIHRVVRAIGSMVEAVFPGVHFDAGVRDAVRVRRISGTVNRRAADPDARHPWRRCELEAIDHAEPVPLAALEDLAAAGETTREGPQASNRTGAHDLAEDVLAELVDALKPAWRDGQRHNAGVYVAGYLWHLGVSLESAGVIVSRLAVGDNKPWDRMKALADTYARGKAGEDVAWFDALNGMLSDLQFGRLRELKRDIEAARNQGTTGASAGGPGEWEIIPPANASREWPTLHRAALHGLAADVVRAIDPTTEGDPVAVLLFFLAAFGSACGRNAYAMVGNDQHGANHYAVLVGESSKARKGNSRTGVLDLMRRADPEWAGSRVMGGLSSGEGLIWQVRDPMEREKKGETETLDHGIDDKRLLAIEDEFSRVFKVAGRQGATISEIVRQAWDGRDVLRVMVKGDTNTATGAHVAIFGNITEAELLVSLSETDMTNGLANRFMWCVVRRSKLIPRPRRLDDATADDLAGCIAEALAFAATAGELEFSDDAALLWDRAYREELSRPVAGIVGSLTARGDAITLRLALTYAVLDCSPEIGPEHLAAALAVWAYAEESVRYLFGDRTGDWIADRILALLREGSKKHIEIVEAFGRNQPAARIQAAIELLNGWGRIVVKAPRKTGTAGRPATVYEIAPDRAA